MVELLVRLNMVWLVGLAVLAVLLRPAAAAEITITAIDELLSAISVRGPIENGDGSAFESLARTSNAKVVILESPGGALIDGLRIGRTARQVGLATLVPAGSSCMSACALAWLGGQKRFAPEGSVIGFHAAYTEGARGTETTGPATHWLVPICLSLAFLRKRSFSQRHKMPIRSQS